MPKSIFKKQFEVRWADLDSNVHMRHTAYAEYCAHVRFKWLESIGLSLIDLTKNGLGAIIFKENLSYIKEIRPNESFSVDLVIIPIGTDGRKWKIIHNVFRENGEIAATVEVEGAWLDLKARKISTLKLEMQKKVDDYLKAQDN